MRTFLAELHARSGSGAHLSAWRTWLLRHPDLARYALASVAVAIALAARLALMPALGEDAPYLFFVPALLVAAGVGGWGPGIMATTLGVLLSFFVIADAAHAGVSAVLNAMAFILVGLGTAWGGE
jgi:two-component system sensor kinase FixL